MTDIIQSILAINPKAEVVVRENTQEELAR